MTFIHMMMVGLGGFFGAIARYAISEKLNNQQSSNSVPLGTLTVNLVGSFFLGVITGMRAEFFVLLIFGIGFIGAFTTFSTLKLEMFELYRNNNKKILLIYTALTYGLGIVLALLGYWIGDYFF